MQGGLLFAQPAGLQDVAAAFIQLIEGLQQAAFHALFGIQGLELTAVSGRDEAKARRNLEALGASAEVLPLAALQIADQVREIRVQEICDYSTYEDPDFTGASFGFGQPLEKEPMMAMPGILSAGWGGMLKMVAEALGVENVERLVEGLGRGNISAAAVFNRVHPRRGDDILGVELLQPLGLGLGVGIEIGEEQLA